MLCKLRVERVKKSIFRAFRLCAALSERCIAPCVNLEFQNPFQFTKNSRMSQETPISKGSGTMNLSAGQTKGRP
jgi:hypothetical protein